MRLNTGKEPGALETRAPAAEPAKTASTLDTFLANVYKLRQDPVCALCGMRTCCVADQSLCVLHGHALGQCASILQSLPCGVGLSEPRTTHACRMRSLPHCWCTHGVLPHASCAHCLTAGVQVGSADCADLDGAARAPFTPAGGVERVARPKPDRHVNHK